MREGGGGGGLFSGCKIKISAVLWDRGSKMSPSADFSSFQIISYSKQYLSPLQLLSYRDIVCTPWGYNCLNF